MPFVPRNVRADFDPNYRTLEQRQAEQCKQLLGSLGINALTLMADGLLTTKAPSRKND